MVKTNLPIIFLRDVILLPNNELRIEINNERDKNILGNAELNHDGHILLINMIDPLEEKPSLNELTKIAILGRIKSKIELPNGIVRLVILGIERVQILNYIENERKELEAFVTPTENYEYDEFEASALRRILFRDLNNYIEISSMMSNSVLGRTNGIKNINILSDIIAYELQIPYNEKIKYIDIINPMVRTRMVIEDINKEIETIKLEDSIESTLKKNLEESQKEFVLRERLKIIKNELGETDIKESDIEKLKQDIASLNAPQEVITKLNKELNKYTITAQTSPEITIIRSYIDWLLKLPWQTSTKDNTNLQTIKQRLNESHYGLEEIKQRIIEYVAVSKNTKGLNSPIICLVGPPGTGKTTLAKSIAHALDKKFVKISVGGVRDEAEIVGHRRTYLGANPGKIIQGIKKAGSNNPVFLIDEVDKMTKDYRGDPASSLLDILDKEQNNIFIDNYIEEEFDLSKVMFILTANSKETIPDALKDRLEIIELSTYTIYEKLSICKNYIIKNAYKTYNIDSNKITFEDDVLIQIITNYTKESGVRELTRLIDKIFRAVTIKLLDNQTNYHIDKNNIENYLGEAKYLNADNIKNNKTGIINALACTNYGGSVIKVSITSYPGKGNLEMTGMLGDVMKESVKIALSYIKSNTSIFGIDYNKFKENDFHIHFEEGAIPKDGPSAGTSIVTAIISLLTNRIIPSNISMTGEITLRGTILPVGGIKEKLISAKISGINKIYLPMTNKRDVISLSNEITDNLNIIYVSDYFDIYHDLFKKKDKKGIKPKFNSVNS